MVGLFGLIGGVGLLGVRLGLPGVCIGLPGLSVPGTPAEGVVPEPAGAMVAPDDGDAFCATRGIATMEMNDRKTTSFFISQSRSQLD
jgi:hypothetical protein